MRLTAIVLALVISLRADAAFALTNSTAQTTPEELRLRGLALQLLTERYPNIEPPRFVYQRMTVTNRTESIAVFAEGRNGRIQYSVRLKLDGELNGIERREECDGGILKISPAPIDRIRPNLPTMFIFTTSPPQTNGIIIIRPEGVPQQLP